MIITHLVPDFLTHGAGNWKDVKSREIVLESLDNIERVELRFNIHDPTAIVSQIPVDTKFVLIEYSWWPELQQSIRSKLPHCKILVRAHNAEGFQNYARHGFKCIPSYNNLRMYYGCARNMWRDHLSCKHADFILGISPWDNEHYWKYLGAHHKIINFPYFCPWPYMQKELVIAPWDQREQAMVSMPGMKDRIGLDMQAGYEKFLRHGIHEKLADYWQFYITAGLGGGRGVSADLPIQLLPEPLNAWQSLNSSRVLLVLGDKGYGMKTNIIDGIAAGCHVVVHEKLYRRLPEILRACCISCHPDKPDTLGYAWSRIQLQPVQKEAELNNRLKAQCLEILSVLLSHK